MAPVGLTVVARSSGLLVSWLSNPQNEGYFDGYKLNWAASSLISQSAADSVAPSVTHYLIPSVDLSEEIVVLVWAYSMEQGDGPVARTTWTPPRGETQSVYYHDSLLQHHFSF